MHSAIYQGWLRHRRFAPKAHAFRYRLFMMYLDLAELDSVFSGRWLWSATRPAWARFRRADHVGDPEIPLDQAVRDLVEQHTGKRPGGPIRLLTHLRYLGYGFSPVNFYYCHDEAGSKVETIVAEVNNTPWGEQHCYVLDESLDQGKPGFPRYRFDKAFHVSPFMPMDIGYDWQFSAPDTQLHVHMALQRGEKIFDATMHLQRRPITGFELAKVLILFPVMTMQVIFSIHWQALRLWLKRVPVHTHQTKATPLTENISKPKAEV